MKDFTQPYHSVPLNGLKMKKEQSNKFTLKHWYHVNKFKLVLFVRKILATKHIGLPEN